MRDLHLADVVAFFGKQKASVGRRGRDGSTYWNVEYQPRVFIEGVLSVRELGCVPVTFPTHLHHGSMSLNPLDGTF